MFLRARALFIFCGFATLLTAANGALANDASRGKQQRASSKCAAYGPGFSAAEGSDLCVWVGGHARMEFGSRSSGGADNGWAAGGAMPAAMRLQDADRSAAGRDLPAQGYASSSPGHLRLHDVRDVTGSIEAR